MPSVETVKWIAIGALVLVLLGGGAYAVYSYNGAIERAQQAEQRAGKLEQENKQWSTIYVESVKERDRLEDIAAQRGKRLQQETAAREEAERKFAELQGKPGPDRDWALAPVPTATRVLRRLNAGCTADLAMPCPPVEPPADTGVPNDRRNERPAKEGSGLPEEPPPLGERG